MRPPHYSPTAALARAEIRRGLWLDSRLALWLEEPRILVIADLHWGYAASHRARGNLLPQWGDEDIEQRLRSLELDYRPAEMIWLGDVVHAAEGVAQAEDFLRAATCPVTVITGNHDRRWRRAQVPCVARGNFFLHHGDSAPPVPENSVEILGHHHPAAFCGDGAGSSVKLPALVAGPRRCILPAFSPWAAGTAWNDRLDSFETLWAIAPTRIFALSQASSTHAAVL